MLNLKPQSGTFQSQSIFGHALLRFLIPTVSLGFFVTAWAQLPAGWNDLDIGGPGQAGSASYANGTWTVSGGGSDIWNGTDQFHFAYTNGSDNSVIIARVTSIQNTDPWAKAGVMFRDYTFEGSMFADVVATPGNGVSFQWRDTPGGNCGY